MKHRDDPESSKQIQPWRKNLHTLGLVLIVIGLILFISPFFSIAGTMNSGFGTIMEGPGIISLGIFGFVLVVLGIALRGIGAKGLAGSGIVLDPEKAREDLQPYAKALGGMARDAVDSFMTEEGEKAPQPQVVIRCRSCKTLNPEDAVYCKQCGEEL